MYGFYGVRYDASRDDCRMVTGNIGICDFFLVGDGMLSDHIGGDSLFEDRSGICQEREKERIICNRVKYDTDSR